MDEGEESIIFSLFVTQIKLLFYVQNIREACPQIKYKLIVQRKTGHIFSYHVPKRPKDKKKKVPQFKFQNGLKQKTFIFWAFLRQIGLWEPNPKNNI